MSTVGAGEIPENPGRGRVGAGESRVLAIILRQTPNSSRCPEEEWLEINEALTFGTLVGLDELDKNVAFGDVQLTYEGEPFDSILNVITSGAKTVAGLGDVPELETVSAQTRVDALRLLAAGGEVIAVAEDSEPIESPDKPKISIGPAFNRGIIKEFGLVLPRIPLAAPKAGTAIAFSNIDAMLLLAICEKGWDGAVKFVAKLVGSDDGEIVMGGRSLTKKEVNAHLSDRVEHIRTKRLKKLLELGVVLLAD